MCKSTISVMPLRAISFCKYSSCTLRKSSSTDFWRTDIDKIAEQSESFCFIRWYLYILILWILRQQVFYQKQKLFILIHRTFLLSKGTAESIRQSPYFYESQLEALILSLSRLMKLLMLRYLR